jgi:hypothetical protein
MDGWINVDGWYELDGVSKEFRAATQKAGHGEIFATPKKQDMRT